MAGSTTTADVQRIGHVELINSTHVVADSDDITNETTEEYPIIALVVTSAVLVIMGTLLLVSFTKYHSRVRYKSKHQKEYAKATNYLVKRRIGAPVSSSLYRLYSIDVGHGSSGDPKETDTMLDDQVSLFIDSDHEDVVFEENKNDKMITVHYHQSTEKESYEPLLSKSIKI